MTRRTRLLAAALALCSHLFAGLLAGWFHVHSPGACECTSGSCATAQDKNPGHKEQGHAHHGHAHHGHDHAHHRHDGLGHQHDSAANTPSPEKQPRPAHDDDRCELCRYLALSVLLAPPATILQPTGVTCLAVESSPAAPFLAIPRTYLSRGPPLS